MKQVLNKFFRWYLQSRHKGIERFKQHPIQVQEQVLHHLLNKARNTQFGQAHGFKQIRQYEDFRKQVPFYDYAHFRPYIDEMMRGKPDVAWPGNVKWFAMSSGTTGGRSKFIPISKDALEYCHYKAGTDLYALYYQQNPHAKVLTGKNLVLGGSHQINRLNSNSRYGDLSAVLMQNVPLWATLNRYPDLDTALMEDWEAKIDRIARESIKHNITSMLGVPTWTVVLIEKIFEITGKDNLADVWPNLELYTHGGVSFEPYRKLFDQLIRNNKMHYLETYNASEGFFAIQDQKDSNEMLLMLDYGVFYEFIPLDQYGEEKDHAVDLSEVTTGQNYAIVISTNAGLWRYKIGDTVRFTSLSPYRIRLTGRTTHFINAFGEEVIVENAESALTRACEATGAIVSDFTAGPVYFTDKHKGGHEWLIEFEKAPDDATHFKQVLDKALQDVNSDYEAKRYKNMALNPPVVHQLPKGTFYRWMKAKGKLGGQHKVPRLANHREYLDDLLAFTDKPTSF